MQPKELERYTRQILFEPVGIEGQKRLKEGRVLVVGAGGLGCPALMQLAASGVGTIGIVDGDRVERSNLPRQPLFTTETIGHNKARAASRQLKRINPHVSMTAYPNFLNEANAEQLLALYDIIIDATDRSPPRYTISRYCEREERAHIYGAVEGMSGQLAVFNVYNANKQSYSYSDLFPEPLSTAHRCSEAGILGMIPHSIGTIQALEAIKLLLGQRSPLQSHLMTINYESFTQHLIALSSNPRPHQAYTLRPRSVSPLPISLQELKQLSSSLLIDVRGKTESKKGHSGGLWLPLDTLLEHTPLLPTNSPIITYCQTGKRAKRAAHLLKDRLPKADVRYLTESPQNSKIGSEENLCSHLPT